MPHKPNILIVDPNTQDLQLLEISLRNMGFAVTTATNSFDALKKVEIFPPDLIISETHFKDFDGFSLCRNIKENKQWTQIPFIFLSSDRNLQSKVKGLQLGIDDYLTKPIFLVELVARIKILMQIRERESIEKHESRTRFTGSLDEIGIMDIIQTIDLSKKKGVVHLAHDGDTGAIYFEDGNIIDAEYSQLDGAEAIYRMMRWTEGFFDIEFRPIRRDRKIDLGPQQLLMEGLRRLDEWNRILEQLPPLETIFNVDVLELVDRLDEIPDEVNGLVSLFDGRRSLKEIVNNDIFSDLDTLRIVSKMIFFGVLVEFQQKMREVKERVRADVVVGAQEEPARKKAVEAAAKPAAPPADLQFGKAEEVDVLKIPVQEAPRAPEAPAKAEKPDLLPGRGEPIARIAVKKVPVEIISERDGIDDEVTMRREFVRGKEVTAAPATALTEEAAALKTREEGKTEPASDEMKEETIKIKAAQIPAAGEEKAKAEAAPAPAAAPAPKEEKQAPEGVLGAIDSKLQKMKEMKEMKEEKVKTEKEEKVVTEEAAEEAAAGAGRDAKTARMFAGKTPEAEAPEMKVGAEKKAARWTFPSVTETKEKEEKAVEEKPSEEAPARREVVQAISLKEVKEEIEKREKEAEKKPELSESGVYKKEEKEFFTSNPPGSEPLDTFADLDWGQARKPKSTKGLTYAIWSIIILGIAAVLVFAFGRDYFKQGPDLTLLKKLDKVDNTSSSATALHTRSLQEVSPMEKGETAPEKKEGEEAQPAAGTQEGTKEGEGEQGEGAEEGKKEGEGAEAQPAEKEQPQAAPEAAGAYGALLAEAKALLQQKKKKEAVEKYKEAVQVNPDGQEALSFLIDVYKERPKEQGVLDWGKRATELGPNDSKAWFGYGLALFTAGKAGEAKPVFEHCVAITPPDASVVKCKQMMKWVK